MQPFSGKFIFIYNCVVVWILFIVYRPTIKSESFTGFSFLFIIKENCLATFSKRMDFLVTKYHINEVTRWKLGYANTKYGKKKKIHHNFVFAKGATNYFDNNQSVFGRRVCSGNVRVKFMNKIMLKFVNIASTHHDNINHSYQSSFSWSNISVLRNAIPIMCYYSFNVCIS